MAHQVCLLSWMAFTDVLPRDVTRQIVGWLHLAIELRELPVTLSARCVCDKTKLVISAGYPLPYHHWILEPYDKIGARQALCDSAFATVHHLFALWIARHIVDPQPDALQFACNRRYLNVMEIELNRGADHWLETASLVGWMRQKIVPFRLRVIEV